MRDIREVIGAIINCLPDQWLTPHDGICKKAEFECMAKEILDKPQPPESHSVYWSELTYLISRRIGSLPKWGMEVNNILLGTNETPLA